MQIVHCRLVNGLTELRSTISGANSIWDLIDFPLDILSNSSFTDNFPISLTSCPILVIEGVRKSRYILSSNDMRDMSSGINRPVSRIAFNAPSPIVLLSAKMALGL